MRVGANPSQVDTDGDGKGDACYADRAIVPWKGDPSTGHPVATTSAGRMQFVATNGYNDNNVGAVNVTLNFNDGSPNMSFTAPNSITSARTHTFLGSHDGTRSSFTATVTQAGPNGDRNVPRRDQTKTSTSIRTWR